MRTCEVDRCGQKHFCKGYCVTHYNRWKRHGDPVKLVKTGNNELKKWVFEKAVRFRGSECLEWPYGKSDTGYGSITVDGRKLGAHRYVCEQVNGIPPAGRKYTAHICGNRACVNPRHLYWATPSENVADTKAHGRSVFGSATWNAKLSDRCVRENRKRDQSPLV